MERDDFTPLTFDRPIPIVLVNAAPGERTFDPNDPHYLYQERKKSRILQRSMSVADVESPPPPPPAVVLQGDTNDPHTLLRAVFQYYCRFGRTSTQGCSTDVTLDNVNFAKFCRDCPHLIGPSFTLVDVDLTFCKVKLKRERRITYAMFLEAMGIMALKKYPNLALEVAVPKLLQEHIATLPCLRPGSSSPNRASVVCRVTPSPPKSPLRSPLSTLNHGQQLDPPNTVITLEKTQLSLEQYQRQVHMVNTLSRVNSASQAEVQDLEDRIKFCYMLQDEVAELVSDLPRGYEAYRRICKEVEILSANLEASVKYMAKVHLHRSGVVVAEDSPRKRENAALNKLFPHGMAPGIQETMKQIMQAEHDRVRFKDAKRPVDDKDDDGDDADSFRPSEFSDLCLGHMEDTAHSTWQPDEDSF
ncbi:hypothetical protein H257_03043 [Aphanomyces astaci]|uniref:Uncharacterized protein n=1 Tax=Aphanomyces astaci TaxID=112090 RepID=W4H0X4_APHAT|nr:hypothetical protein H257_03043 [Aphanomyces astaci]ETV85231.1 hypothetical protein H257_03043 [Aphanomyces astaci]|eukprot:XP_009825249.1 hypothetical protein H257_03043 [Aphanomyces astaci]